MELLLEQVRSFLVERSVDAYFVGGYVRDLLLGRETNDIDIAVTGDALSLARALADAVDGHFVLLDEANSIARVVSGQEYAYVDVSTLRGSRIEDDLAARDFTFNAMALPLTATGRRHVIDPFGGQRDLKTRTVRAISDRTFVDDPVRLLRAVRFVAQLGCRIEPKTMGLIARDAPLLARVAGERVRDEFAKVLGACGAWSHLRLLDELGLLSIVLPELDALRGIEQPGQHYYDVFEHTLAVTDAVEETLIACQVLSCPRGLPRPPHPALPQAVLGTVADRVREHVAELVSADRTRLVTLKLGALFHDIAKPLTKTTDDQGNAHFYNHPVVGQELTETALRRLRFSVREIRIVTALVLNHMRPAQMAADSQMTRKAVYRFFRDVGSDSVDTLLLSLADHIGTRGPLLDPSAWWRHAQFTRLMLEHYYAKPIPTRALPRLVTGADVMKTFGLPPGKRIGELLELVREAQAIGDVRTREEALAYLARMLQEDAETD